MLYTLQILNTVAYRMLICPLQLKLIISVPLQSKLDPTQMTFRTDKSIFIPPPPRVTSTRIRNRSNINPRICSPNSLFVVWVIFLCLYIFWKHLVIFFHRAWFRPNDLEKLTSHSNNADCSDRTPAACVASSSLSIRPLPHRQH